MDSKNTCHSEAPYKFEPYMHKINGTIANAIGRYECNRVSLKQLLTDYNDVITYPEYLKKAINPWEYLNKGISRRNVVCGVSVAETLFNVSAMSLYKQKPIDVIKGIYYRRKDRNDSGLEYYFFSLYNQEIQKYKWTVIVNPSPVMVECFEKTGNSYQYIVTDETLAQLYAKQYRRSTFVSFENADKISGVDMLVLFVSNIEENQIQEMMGLINVCKARKICGIIHTRLIDNKKSSFWKNVLEGKLCIREIVITSNNMSVTSPKKKSLIYLERKEEQREREKAEDKTEIWRADLEESTKLVIQTENKLIVSQEKLLKYNTINMMWKQSIEENSEKKKTGMEYATADLYPFTKEIYLSYAIYPEKKGVCGKAYYAETKNMQIPSIRGKALTERMSRGLRGATAEEVVGAMEDFAYIPKVSEVICTDIITHYLEEGVPVSLKTLWFCLRDDLQKNTSYDDAVMKKLFTDGKKVAELYLSKASEKIIQNAVAELIEPGEEKKELQLLKMLNVVVAEAIKQGYLSENRILPLLPAAKNQATKRQNQVRQALAKRSFENIEEEKIMKYLKLFYVERSSYLAVLIRLMTGISLRESSALLWRNFQYNKDTDVYTLSITKFVDNSGKLVSHALEESWEKYRTLPISMFLGKIIEERKEFLMRKGIAAEVLDEYPIVLGREDFNNILKGHKSEFCKPAFIAQKCRESISKAEIVQHMLVLPDEENGAELETDINSYGGDIFKTNFREKALNAAGFSLDEVNYYLGIKKPDTFSQHYCDYTNDYVQLIMARKLDRWQSKYFSIMFVSRKQVAKPEVRGEMDFTGRHEGVPGAIVELKNANKNLEMEIQSKHGFKITVLSYALR